MSKYIHYMSKYITVMQLVRPTLTSAEDHISHFVISMMDLRRKMVLHIEGNFVFYLGDSE